MKPPGPEAPVVLVKWYDYAKWLLERAENFPKSQRFVLGQRLTGQALDVLVEASYARDKSEILATANRKMEVLRWTVCMARVFSGCCIHREMKNRNACVGGMLRCLPSKRLRVCDGAWTTWHAPAM